jgi:hypothetical protein
MHVYGFAPMNSGGCHWYRIRQPLIALAGLGHVTDWGAEFNEDVVRSHEVIVNHMLHEPAGLTAWGYLRDEGQHTLITDVDDNPWAWPAGTDHARYWTPERLANLEAIMKMSHAITTPSSNLREEIIERLGIGRDRVSVLGNYVPSWALADEYEPDRQRFDDALVIGYQGAPQGVHQFDLDTIQTALFRILDRYSYTRLAFFGQPKPLDGAGKFADRIDFIPWNPSVPEYYQSLKERVDIGIGPLVPSPFTRCKSPIRMVEWAALGIPAVYSFVDPYKSWELTYRAGRQWCGLARNESQWFTILESLVTSRERREKWRTEGLALAASLWTSEHQAWQWQAVYENSRPALIPRVRAHPPDASEPAVSNTNGKDPS